jgi:hypothetical protein
MALGGSLGPEISQIEGRVLERADGEYVLAVSNVRLLRGGEQVWAGEHVRIKSDYVTSTYARRFSRQRTLVASLVRESGRCGAPRVRDNSVHQGRRW